MPFEDDTSDNEFENNLGEAIRRTGETFATDRRRALLEAGVRRGRVKLARRRAAAVTGGLLAVAMIGTVGAYEGGLLDRPDGTSVADKERGESPRPKPRVTISGKPDPRHGDPKWFMRASADQMIKLLEISLPKGEFSKQRGTSNFGGPDDVANASLVYDDGYGKSLVSISARRVDPNDKALKKSMTTCPAKSSSETCVTDIYGHKIRQSLVDGKKPASVKKWQALRISGDGFLLEATEYNAPAGKGVEATRTKPPLTAMQLGELAGAVEGAFTKFGVMNAETFSSPRPIQGSWEVRETLESLVPTGLSQRGLGGLGDEGYIVVYDAKLKVKTFLRATVASGTPDGGKVRTQQRAGKQPGSLEWSAESVTPQGLRVTVTAFNSQYPNQAAVRPEPPLTLAQLSAMATSDKWHNFK
ncbi:hypothetical protein [Streptomyces sp. NBC_01481]|uniref:hypothetical protein n=1 Tax=Streptomyces sp. NBC_01481 TaxID=2975869 RepID=UPI002255D294|nr:hypothetical protein [Streptomyces sp. NBC_01481]MCX4583760.1 hypothetical protein [Streptomyces sp. NBC_01481]